MRSEPDLPSFPELLNSQPSALSYEVSAGASRTGTSDQIARSARETVIRELRMANFSFSVPIHGFCPRCATAPYWAALSRHFRIRCGFLRDQKFPESRSCPGANCPRRIVEFRQCAFEQID